MNRIRIVLLMILFSMTASGCMRTYDDLKMIAVRNSNAI